MNAKQKLESVDDIQDRIDLVAKDLESSKDRFKVIDPYELAELVGLQPGDGDWSRTRFTPKVSLDDTFDPRLHIIHHLEGKVPAERFAEIQAAAERFDEGETEVDVALTRRESEIIEDALSEENCKNGFGWVIASTTLVASDGTELEFEAEIGDGGDCFGCYGPYQIRDGNGASTEGLYEGESW